MRVIDGTDDLRIDPIRRHAGEIDLELRRLRRLETLEFRDGGQHRLVAVPTDVRQHLRRGLFRLFRKRRTRVEPLDAPVARLHNPDHDNSFFFSTNLAPIMHFTVHSTAGSPFAFASPFK